jgi:hypothetical protein
LHHGKGQFVDIRDVVEHQHIPQQNVEWRQAQRFPPEEVFSVICPFAYNDLKRTGIWDECAEFASDLSGKIAHNVRKSLTNVIGGFGKYKVTFLGRAAGRIMEHFMIKLTEKGFDASCIPKHTWEGLDHTEKKQFCTTRRKWDGKVGGKTPTGPQDEGQVGGKPVGPQDEGQVGGKPVGPQDEGQVGGKTPTGTGPQDEEVAAKTAQVQAMMRFLEHVTNTAGKTNDGDLAKLQHRIKRLTPRIIVDGVKVGLATTCRGRLEHLKVTVPLTQLMCMEHLGRFQQCVILSKSDREAVEWMTTEMQAAIQVGTLRVGVIDEEHFHACLWKNAAHKLASEQCDIVINWDGLRTPGDDFPTAMLEIPWSKEPPTTMDEDIVVGMLCSSGLNTGTYGTLGLSSWLYWMLGGYDEDFLPMGCQDTDLLRRVRTIGKLFHIDQQSIVGDDLPNDIVGMHVGKQHKENKVLHVAPQFRHLRWGQMDQRNRELMNTKMAGGEYVRNINKHLGYGVQELEAPPLRRVDIPDASSPRMTTHDHAMFLSSHVAMREAREILKQLAAFRLLTAEVIEDRWTKVLANPRPGQVTKKCKSLSLLLRPDEVLMQAGPRRPVLVARPQQLVPCLWRLRLNVSGVLLLAAMS